MQFRNESSTGNLRMIKMSENKGNKSNKVIATSSLHSSKNSSVFWESELCNSDRNEYFFYE